MEDNPQQPPQPPQPLEDSYVLNIYNNNDLSENISRLQVNVKSISNVSEELLNILYLFNDYLDNININNHSIIIINLLKLFQEKKEKIELLQEEKNKFETQPESIVHQKE